MVATVTRSTATILIRRRCLARLNRLRALRQTGWRQTLPAGVAIVILGFYGVFWALSLIRELAALQLPRLIPAAGAASLIGGLIAGFGAAAHDRATIAAPYLAVLPWPPADRRKALLVSLASHLGTRAVIGMILLDFAATTADLSDPMVWAAFGTALYSLGLGAGYTATGRHVPKPHARSRPPGTSSTTRLARFDRATPRWAGWWGLAPNATRTAWIAGASLIGGLSVAQAAATGHHPVALAPGVASIGPLLVVIAALRCAPLVSPVLRTTPLRYRLACLAMVRLPALCAAGWFAAFSGAALALGLLRWRSLEPAGAIALSLSLGYTLIALSVPNSPRAALVFYLIALAFAADEYTEIQNLVAVLLLILSSSLLLRARTRFHGTR